MVSQRAISVVVVVMHHLFRHVASWCGLVVSLAAAVSTGTIIRNILHPRYLGIYDRQQLAALAIDDFRWQLAKYPGFQAVFRC
jgi:hypothetical protein